MKKITKIEYQKNKNRVNIYLDDEFAFGLDLNIMIKYSLSKNMVLEDSFVEEILKAEEEINVYNYGLSVLSRSIKSEKQVREKMLQKGYDPQMIETAVQKLKSHKYIHDEYYAEALISTKINVSKYGRQRIRQQLYESGIQKEIIEEKLSEISEEDETERAYELGLKKFNTMREEDLQKRKGKLYNYLIYRGFHYDTVKNVMSKLFNADF